MSIQKIYDVVSRFYETNNYPKIIIGLCTTSKKGNKSLNYLSGPRKVKTNCFYFHITLDNDKIAISLSKKLFNITNTFFIDIELKNELFSWKIIVKELSKINKQVLFFKIEPNNLTVNKIISLININQSSILIMGTGDIAFKLANRLEKTNFYFNWLRKSNKASQSSTKMVNNYKKLELIATLQNRFDVIINTIPIEIDVNLASFIKKNTFFIEVSSASLNYLTELECKKIKLDVSEEVIGFISYSLEIHRKPSLIGRRSFKNKNICSGGIIGEVDDIVVDNYIKPQFTIGVANGKGGFKSRFIKSFKEYIKDK